MTVDARALYLIENIGVEALSIAGRALYPVENVGVEALTVTGRALYPYDNVVDEPPDPYLESIAPALGPEGTEVVLTGNGFGDAQGDYDGEVYIGGELMGISSWSWTEITATIPVGATSDRIFVRLTDPTTRDSESIYFQVTAALTGTEARIEIKHYRANTLRNILDGAK